MHARMQPIDASFIPASTLAQTAIWIKRGVVVVLWGVTLYGSVAYLDNVLYGMIYQAGLTVAQFAFRRRYTEIWYLVPLIASVWPSIQTYTPLVLDQVADLMIGTVGYDAAYMMAHAIIWIVMFAVDMVPERIVVTG